MQWHIASNEFNINFALDHKEKKKKNQSKLDKLLERTDWCILKWQRKNIFLYIIIVPKFENKICHPYQWKLDKVHECISR